MDEINHPTIKICKSFYEANLKCYFLLTLVLRNQDILTDFINSSYMYIGYLKISGDNIQNYVFSRIDFHKTVFSWHFIFSYNKLHQKSFRIQIGLDFMEDFRLGIEIYWSWDRSDHRCDKFIMLDLNWNWYNLYLLLLIKRKSIQNYKVDFTKLNAIFEIILEK